MTPVMPTATRRRRSRGSESGPASGGEGRQLEGATRTPQGPSTTRRPWQRPSIEYGTDSGSSSDLDTRRPWHRPRIEYGTDSGSSSDVDPRWKALMSRATGSAAANPPPPPSPFVPATNPITSSLQEGKGKGEGKGKCRNKKKKKKKKGKRKRKTDMATASSQSRDQSSSKMAPQQLDMGENGAAAAATATATATRSDTDSDEFSSPIRRPKPLLVKTINSDGDVDYAYNSDKEAGDIYDRDCVKYQKKLARLQQLPTFKPSVDHGNLTDWHDLKQKNAVLDLAESVLSLSSSYDGKAINRCTGFVIEWDEVDGSAVIITSSEIICTKKSLADWRDDNVYASDAKVIAHLWDGTTSEVQLLYFNKHYEIAFFRVNGGLAQRVAPLDPNFEFGTEACVLARDKDLELICRRTTIKALDPCEHQRNHYLFANALNCGDCSGGALANFNGSIVGMMFNARPNTAFLPGSLILKCFKLWKNFRKLARPHLGLKLRTVGFLDISHLDNLSRLYGVRSGLIVAKVSIGSPAERNGIRVGDIIFQCQRESVSTITELENILLDVCEEHFEKGSIVNPKVDVELDVYNLRKRARRTISLSVELSDAMDVIDQGFGDY